MTGASRPGEQMDANSLGDRDLRSPGPPRLQYVDSHNDDVTEVGSAFLLFSVLRLERRHYSGAELGSFETSFLFPEHATLTRPHSSNSTRRNPTSSYPEAQTAS